MPNRRTKSRRRPLGSAVLVRITSCAQLASDTVPSATDKARWSLHTIYGTKSEPLCKVPEPHRNRADRHSVARHAIADSQELNESESIAAKRVGKKDQRQASHGAFHKIGELQAIHPLVVLHQRNRGVDDLATVPQNAVAELGILRMVEACSRSERLDEQSDLPENRLSESHVVAAAQGHTGNRRPFEDRPEGGLVDAWADHAFVPAVGYDTAIDGLNSRIRGKLGIDRAQPLAIADAVVIRIDDDFGATASNRNVPRY